MNKTKQMEADKIKEFLREDLGYGDITSNTLIPHDQKAKARLYFKEPGVASGLEEAALVFEVLGCDVKQLADDGSHVQPKQTLLEIFGSARALLSGERLALNFVCRMAGIATQTARIVEIVAKKNAKARVAATRKTLPGLRVYDKKAVVHGGGDPHRFGLDDCVLIKDNHLKLVPSVTEAVKRVRTGVSFTKMVEIEVRTVKDAEEAALAGADIIMLDNMSSADIRKCLSYLAEKGLRDGFLFEASGGITMENVSEYADSGVDIISLGALTHSVRGLDVKLEIEMI
ncbi:MAG: carboxylating nicotinate-nucleotide diphosphorylase [Candidatus Bathyarchaeota archaeon]|nr:carboxylating nicotinate-nucleotide diphosphorylase [Candidatus Bathyarchaeota archaeon]